MSIVIALFCVISMSHAEMYQTTPRIGYTTTYGNGFQPTSSMRYYNNGAMVGGTYQYKGTYTTSTYNSSSHGGGSGPRRSPGVPTVNGYDSISGTPSFGGGQKGTWRNPYDDERYDENFWGWLLRWGESDYDEYTYDNYRNEFWDAVDWANPTNQNNKYLQDLWVHDHPGQKPPWDPYPSPIGDCIPFLMILAIIYVFYKKIRVNL